MLVCGTYNEEILNTRPRVSFLNPETHDSVYSTELHFRDEAAAYSGHSYIYKSKTNINLTEYLYNNTLSVLVEVELVKYNGNTYKVPLDNIRANMYTLYKDEVLTDMIVKCRGKEFKVHKAVLALQSPVFRELIEVDTAKKQNGVTVEIADISPAAMSDLLAFLYSGTVPNVTTQAFELLDVADKYQLPRLSKLCEYELDRKIRKASVIPTLIMAHECGRICLKKACLEFIRLNSADIFTLRSGNTSIIDTSRLLLKFYSI